MNANDATLTELATTQSGSMVADNTPNAPASSSFDLVVLAAAGSALGSSGAPYTLTISAIDLTALSQPWPVQTLHQAFDTASGWQLSGTGPDYQYTQAFPVPVPGDGPGGPLSRPHPAVRGLPGQPGRPDRLDYPQRSLRACLNPRRPFATEIRPDPSDPAARSHRYAAKAQATKAERNHEQAARTNHLLWRG